VITELIEKNSTARGLDKNDVFLKSKNKKLFKK
jgi:hypothetical protein